MAATLLLRGIPFLRLRLHHHRLASSIFATPRRPCCTAAEPNRADESLSRAGNFTAAWSARDPPKHPRWEDPDYGQWKDKEKEILRDIEPITTLTKEILHSDRYMDGERLTAKDEKAVVEKLLAHHPHSEDKIGCGLDSIMVDRHPQFRCSRCLFVIRTDGGWIDFSYQKCLRAYIRDKYPSHAARFIREHFKRSSDDYTTQQLLSGLPVLEVLYLEKCRWGYRKVLSNSSSKLHSLTIIEADMHNPSDCQFMIFGAALKYFVYSGELFNEYCIYDSFSLESADFDVTCYGEWASDERARQVAYHVFKLLIAIPNVKELRPYGSAYEVRLLLSL